MKHYIMKLLGAQYFVGYSHNRHWLRKFFWNLDKAIAFADKQTKIEKTIVWSLDFKPVYTSPSWNTSLHPDANNFNTNI